MLCLALAVLSLFPAGCSEMAGTGGGANQSLVEIGERSIEQAEDMEAAGRDADANTSYRRAVWAFRYHQHLTGEEPLLLDVANDGVRRTAK